MDRAEKNMDDHCVGIVQYAPKKSTGIRGINMQGEHIELKE